MGNSQSAHGPFGGKAGGTALLIIDPQNDFHEGGALAVAGANEDSKRIAKMIKDNKDAIHQITVTLDSHERLHIANPLFWQDKDGNNPDPFTLIKEKDILEGTWTPSRAELKQHCLEYVRSLEANNRFVLCIWPEHCLIGTPGHNVVASVDEALQEWSAHNADTVQYVNKGTNPLTEMYSGLSADVVIDSDPSTKTNFAVINKLKKADRVVICGEALSHCVNFTTRDLVQHWPADRMSDVIVVSDAASSVAGFESAGEEFVKDMKAKGVRVMKAEEVFA